MKILVTGGAGFIGSHLVERLLSQGHNAVTLDYDTSRRKNLDACCNCAHSWLDCQDIHRSKQLDGVEFIYHLAATVGVKRVLKDPSECIRNNVESLRAVLALGIPGMFTSTSEVYGLTEDPLREDSPMKYSSAPRWSYAASKLVGEWMAKQAGWKVVRLFNVVGPRQSSDYGAVLPKFVSQALRDEPITVYGDGTQTRTFTDVRDCAVMLDQLRDKEFDVVNVAGCRITDMNILAQQVKLECKSKSQIVHVPYEKAYGPGFEDCASRIPCVEKLHSLLPDRPATSFLKTIRDLAKDISSNQIQDKEVTHV